MTQHPAADSMVTPNGASHLPLCAAGGLTDDSPAGLHCLPFGHLCLAAAVPVLLMLCMVVRLHALLKPDHLGVEANQRPQVEVVCKGL